MEFRRLLWLRLLGLSLIIQANSVFGFGEAEIVRKFSTSADGQNIISQPSLSPDGSKLAVELWFRSTAQTQTSIYEVATGRRILEIKPLPGDISANFLAFSPDGSRCIVDHQHHDNVSDCSVIDLSTGQPIYHFSVRHHVDMAVFLSDGKKILHDSDTDLPGFTLDDVSGQSPSRTFIRPNDDWIGLLKVFSPDGRWVLSSAYKSNGICVLDLNSASLVSRLQDLGEEPELQFTFVSRGQKVMGVDGQGVARTWDARSGKLLSKIEPSKLIELHPPLRLIDNGGRAAMQNGDHLEFYDTMIGKIVGLWAPPPATVMFPETFTGKRIVVGMDNRGGVLAVMNVEMQPHVHTQKVPPEIALRLRDLSPSISPAVAIPEHSTQNLHDADFWLKRAEAESNATTNQMVRDEMLSQLAIGYAAIGDDAGTERMLQATARRFKPAPTQFWNPVDSLHREIAVYQVQRMVASGHTQSAIALAKSLVTTRPPDDRVLSEVVVAETRTGDIAGAILTMGDLNKSSAGRTGQSAVRVLASEGKFSQADQVADAMTDQFWQGEAYIRIAEAKAKKDDVGGTITELAKIKNRGGHELQKVVATLAALPDDAGAQKVIESLPAGEQQNAWGWLQAAQLKRGDIVAAKVTEQRLVDIDSDFFAGEIAQVEIRLGKVDHAIAGAKAAKVDDRMVDDVLNALVKYDHPDALLDLLANLPPSRATNYDYARLRNGYYLRAATLLAQDNRLADAQRVLALAHPQNDRYGNDDGLYTQAQWEIAGAMRRASDHSGYQKALQPFLNAIASATGAPSCAEAQSNLFAFYMTVGDYAGAAALTKQMDPELSRGVTMSIAMMLDPRTQPDQREVKRDLSQTRALLEIAASTINGPIATLMMNAAKKHVEANAEAQWLQWAIKLPTAQGRISAYMAMADALLPPSDLNDSRG